MNSSLYKMAFFSIILFLISSSASAAMEREAVGGNKTDTILTRPNASQVVYISPTKDAYGESCPANTATGNQFNIYLGYDTWYGKCRTRPFFHFSLSSIPVGSTIDSAQLEIYQYAVETTSSYGVVAYPITQNWDEYILTWNNQPSVGNAIGWSTFSTGLGWKYIGLTTLARNWYSGVTNNYGVALRRGTNEYYKGGIFYSRNCSSSQCSSGQRPRLKVVYTPPATYFVSGQVIDNQGVAMSDVTISDNAGHTTATDGNGNYQLNGLLAGDYTLTPSKSDYIFSPTSKMISVSSNVSEQNFVGTLTVFMVSGKVTDNYDNPVVDVIISDGVGHTTVTDINGNYNISGLSGGTYTLTPSRAQFTFTPNNRIVALSDVNIVGQNFTMIMGCEDRSAVDVVLTLDKSGSMDGTPLTTAKNDSKYFIDLLSLSADQVGLVSFNDTIFPNSQLTSDGNYVKAQIDSLSASGGTDIAGAIRQAEYELRNSNNKTVIILLSDGKQDPPDSGDPVFWANQAKAVGVRIITIGLEPDQDGPICSQPNITCELDKETLTSVASSPSDFYYAPTFTDLHDIYEKIAANIGCSEGKTVYLPIVLHGYDQSANYSISGRIANSNGDPESGVLIIDGLGHTDVTDANGYYTLSGLTARSYSLTLDKTDCTFSPSSRTVSVPPNATDQDFVAMCGNGSSFATIDTDDGLLDSDWDSVYLSDPSGDEFDDGDGNPGVDIVKTWIANDSDSIYFRIETSGSTFANNPDPEQDDHASVYLHCDINSERFDDNNIQIIVSSPNLRVNLKRAFQNN